MRLFYTYGDSAFWKKQFLHRSLTRDLQAYSEWHREQAGDSPMKRLSSIPLLGSPVPLVNLDGAVAPVASTVAAELVAELSFFRCEDLVGLLSCRSPTAAISGVVEILMARLLRSFRHWTCVTMWHQSSRGKVLGRFLVCGAAEWGVLVKREDDDDPLLNYGYWNSKGECLLAREVAEASLSRWEEKLKRAPVWEDYDSRCLPIPTRLQGEHAFHTPGNLGSKKRGDEKKKKSGEEMVASPMKSFETGDSSFRTNDTLVLYLANDFHWRGAKFVTVSAAGLAILKFKCKDKEVQLSRCMFVNVAEFSNRVDTMAQTEDYSKRGLELPYGYKKEMLMMRLGRWSSRRSLKT